MATKVSISSKMTLFTIPFEVSSVFGDEIILKGTADLSDENLTLEAIVQKIFDAIKVEAFAEFPTETTVKLLELKLNLTKSSAAFRSEFGFKVGNFQKDISIYFQALEKGKTIVIGFKLDGGLGLSDLPIIKDRLADYLDLSLSQFITTTKKIENFSPPDAESTPISLERGINMIGNIKFLETNTPLNMLLVPFAARDENKPVSRGVTEPTKATVPKSSGLSKYINLNKQIGPINLKRLGFEYKDAKIGIAIDANISIMGLTASVMGLKMTTPVKFPPEPTFSIDGVGISFFRDPIGIAGAFLRIDNPDYQQYLGTIIVKVPKFMIAGFGGYAIKKDTGQKSIFGFVALEAPLGGIPEFFIMGLSGGFGFNSTLTLPPISELEHFPFLNPSSILEKDPMDALAMLDKYVKPQPQAYWFAFGIKAMTYELLYYQVLLTVDTAKLQIALLGLASMKLPQGSAKPFVGIELAIQASISLKEGIFILAAQLTSNSYIIDPNAKLQGGFALYAWFKGEQAGDMVLSIGGYHPKFKKPDYYPVVPRVGFTWKISDKVVISGGGYFALTPTAVMAGLKLQLAFHAGNLKAWFIAKADMLLQWKPFYFEVYIGIQIGISYKLNLGLGTKNFKIEMSAELFLFGTPIGGYVKIDWKIISFTIKFGPKSIDTSSKILDWDKFDELFLPKSDTQTRSLSEMNNEEVCKINIANGLIKELTLENELKEELKVWIVRPDELVFGTDSYIPINNIYLSDVKQSLEDIEVPKVGVTPMNRYSLDSKHYISLQKDGSTVNISDWKWIANTKNVPAALWSPTPLEKDVPEHKMIIGMTGLSGLYPPEFVPTGLPASDISNFAYLELFGEKPLALTGSTPCIQVEIEEGEGLKTLEKTIMASATKAKRTATIGAINSLLGDFHKIEDGDLTQLSKQATDSFLAPPQLGKITKNGTIDKSELQIVGSRSITEQIVELPSAPTLKFAFQNRKYLRPVKTKRPSLRSRGLALEPEKHIIHIGENVLFDLDCTSRTSHELAYNGAIGLQIISFDEHQEIIDLKLVQSGKIGIESIKSKTRQLSVTGVAPLASSLTIKGWDADTSLMFTNSQALIAEGVTIRTQIPMVLDKKEKVTVRSLHRRNKIIGQSTTKKGWLYTTTFGDLKEIVLIIQSLMPSKRDLEESLKTLKVTLKPKGGRAILLKITNTQQEGNRMRVCFSAPTEITTSDKFEIGTFIADNWEIHTLMILDKKAPENHWKTCQLGESIFPKSGNYHLETTMELIYKEIT